MTSTGATQDGDGAGERGAGDAVTVTPCGDSGDGGDSALRAGGASLSQTWRGFPSGGSAGPGCELGGGLLVVPPALAVGVTGGGGGREALKTGEGMTAAAGAEAGPAEAGPAAVEKGDEGRVSLGSEPPAPDRDGPPRKIPACESLEQEGKWIRGTGIGRQQGEYETAYALCRQRPRYGHSAFKWWGDIVLLHTVRYDIKPIPAWDISPGDISPVDISLIPAWERAETILSY